REQRLARLVRRPPERQLRLARQVPLERRAEREELRLPAEDGDRVVVVPPFAHERSRDRPERRRDCPCAEREEADGERRGRRGGGERPRVAREVDERRNGEHADEGS